MWDFYWDVVSRFPAIAAQSFKEIQGIGALVLAGVIMVYPRLGEKLHLSWKGINPRWAGVPLVFWFACLVLQANYSVANERLAAEIHSHDRTAKALLKQARENEMQAILLRQETEKNAGLIQHAPVLTDSQLRLDTIRQQMFAHADKAPTKERYTVESGKDWLNVALSMYLTTIDSGKSSLSMREWLDDKAT